MGWQSSWLLLNLFGTPCLLNQYTFKYFSISSADLYFVSRMVSSAIFKGAFKKFYSLRILCCGFQLETFFGHFRSIFSLYFIIKGQIYNHVHQQIKSDGGLLSRFFKTPNYICPCIESIPYCTFLVTLVMNCSVYKPSDYVRSGPITFTSFDAYILILFSCFLFFGLCMHLASHSRTGMWW